MYSGVFPATMKKILLIFCLLCSLCSAAQVPRSEDSLATFLKTHPKDSLYCWALRPYALIQIYEKGNQTKGDSLAEVLLHLGEALHYGRGIYFGYLIKAIVNQQRNEPRAMLSHFEKCLETVNRYQLNPNLQEATLNNIATAHDALGDPDNAMKYALLAISVQEKNHFKKMDAAPYEKVGNVLKHYKKYDQALFYYKKGLEISEKKQDFQSMAIAENKIGNLYDDWKKPQDANQHYKTGLDYAEKSKYLLLQTDLLSNLGRLATDFNRFGEAEKYLKKNEMLCKSLESNQALRTAYIGLGSLSLRQKKYPTAEKYFLQADSLSQALDAPHLKQVMKETLADFYAETGKYAKAFQLLKEANVARDSAFQMESATQTQELLTRYETEKKEQHILLLKKENENQNLQLENEIRTRYLLFAILGFSVLTAALLWRSYRLKQKSNQALGEKNEELLSLNEELGLINERLDEANQTKSKLFSVISHDLRSPVSQLITYLNLQRENPELLDAETKAGFEESLRASSENLLYSLEDLLAWSKSQLEHFTLFSEEIHAESFFKEVLDFHRKSAFEKQVSLLVQVPEALTFQTDPNFLKVILRNLLANAIKFTPPHGGITLEAKKEAAKLHISITDTGQGMTESQMASLFNENITSSSSGWGLKITKEFAEKLGGSLKVSSQPGKGTVFQVEIPL